MNSALLFNASTSAEVSVIFSPIRRICSEVLFEFSACSAEFSTIRFTAERTLFIVPLVLSAAVPSKEDASNSFWTFWLISRIVLCIASRRVIVTLERSPISSLLLSSFLFTCTFKLPAAIFSTVLILVLIFLLIVLASFVLTIRQTSIIAATAATIDPKSRITTASLSCLLVPTKIIPTISVSEPFWYTGIK